MRCYLVTDTQVSFLPAAPTKASAGILITRSSDLDVRRFPVSRLIAIRNALPGVAPVRRFADRSKAIKSLWTELEKLPLGAVGSSHSKQSLVQSLLRRPEGCDLEGLMSATGWQRHSVRGLLSGTFRKRMGLTIQSSVEGDRRVYRIAA